MKKFALIFCFILIFAISFFAFNLNSVSADSTVEIENDITIIDGESGNYKLTKDITLSDEIENYVVENFSGTLDGNGKTITFDLSLTGGNAGLFGKLLNAKIKNLCVIVNVDACQRDQYGNIVYENEKIVSSITSALNFGGLAGATVGGSIEGCKTAVNFYNTVEDNKVNISSNYAINFGGLIGQSQGATISNCFSQGEIKFELTAEGNFGGIVGKMTNGSVENCYFAPNQNLISGLVGVVSENANLEINNLGSASVCFGGIVGYGEGSNLSLTNTLAIAYLKEENVVFGGIIGKVNSSTLFKPQSQNITYCKYLKVASTNLATFNSAIGNAGEVSFAVHATNEEITTFPTSSDYFENGTFDSFKNWDFDSSWKKQNIYDAGGIFLPDLQMFSQLTINLQYQNYTNFYEFYFDGDNTKSLTSKEFPIGSAVKLIAKLKTTAIEGTNVIPSQFYQFVYLRKVGDSEFAKVLIKDGDEYYYEFTCTNSTAGSYYVEIKGNPVAVNVHILKDNTEDAETEFGKIKYLNVDYTQDFVFAVNMIYADDSDARTIEAVDISEKYKFSGFKDENNDNPHFQTNSRILTFKLNNNTASPKVYYNNGLKCDIYAIFSNNTTTVEFTITRNAGKILIDGQEITSKTSLTLIANKEYEFEIVPEENYELNKIVVNQQEINLNNNKIQFSKLENNKFKAELKEIEKTATSVNIWLIIIPIVAVVFIGGITAIIIVSIKKKNDNSYKKNFRY